MAHLLPYKPLVIEKFIHLKIFILLLEEAKEMETNHIVHATQENLPVYIYNH
jgi:hypothetical protein